MPVLVNLEFTRGTHVSSELFMLKYIQKVQQHEEKECKHRRKPPQYILLEALER